MQNSETSSPSEGLLLTLKYSELKYLIDREWALWFVLVFSGFRICLHCIWCIILKFYFGVVSPGRQGHAPCWPKKNSELRHISMSFTPQPIWLLLPVHALVLKVVSNVSGRKCCHVALYIARLLLFSFVSCCFKCLFLLLLLERLPYAYLYPHSCACFAMARLVLCQLPAHLTHIHGRIVAC